MSTGSGDIELVCKTKKHKIKIEATFCVEYFYNFVAILKPHIKFNRMRRI
jgi:hypothetical protein